MVCTHWHGHQRFQWLRDLAAAGPRAEMPSYTTSAVSMAQCERLAQKSRAKKGWFG